MNGSILLRGGRIVDPGSDMDGLADLRVRDGRVAEIGRLQPDGTEAVVKVDGLVVSPGFIDVHAHLREPGQEWKETLATGTAAAAAGGFTTVFCMPNTDPPLDSVVMLEELKRRARRDAVVRLAPIATISEGRRGRRPVDYAALAAAGAVGFSDDGESTTDSGVMAAALRASRGLGVPVMVHCEDPTLAGGAMHDGDISRKLKLAGLPAEAEEIVIARDVALAEMTGGWLHVCHVSTARGAEIIADARRRGARVTGELMPHHLTMTDTWVAGGRQIAGGDGTGAEPGRQADQDTKVNPPLRTARDARRLLDFLHEGVCEVISTDHAPHARTEKQGRPFPAAAFGFSGSELALPLLLSLVRAGDLSLSAVVRALSSAPARLWGLDTGSLRPGAPADIAIFDPEERWIPRTNSLRSRGANTPLLDREVQGRVTMTFVDGEVRHRDC